MSKTEPAWLKSMKAEAAKLGIPLRELLTQNMKKAPAKKKKTTTTTGKKKTVMAAKGGYMAKKKKKS
tara:strand:+ start:50 stop:250 length:201 start_codon:yes stop_codon:yes gene_type:complete